jgi:hypothetical protein
MAPMRLVKPVAKSASDKWTRTRRAVVLMSLNITYEMMMMKAPDKLKKLMMEAKIRPVNMDCSLTLESL